MIKTTLKTLVAASLIPAATLALAQGHDMTGMKGMDMPAPTSPARQTTHITHMAQGTVKAISVKDGEVTIAHGPIKTLNWPAMTMGFMVHDKTLFNKLAVGKKIDFEIVAYEKSYLVVAVK